MRSPVLAILWQFLARNPVMMAVSALLWLVLAVLCRVVPVGPESPPVVFLLGLSFALVLIGLLHTFSFSSVEPLASRESGFPRRMFLLPLSTPALVGLPMLLGSLAMIGLWVVWSVGVFWPSGVNLPLLWPALALGVLLAWLQAIAWSPFPVANLRAPAAGLVLGLMVSLAIMAVALERFLEMPWWIGLAVYAALLPAGYGLAVHGVARARRGDEASWRWVDRLGEWLAALRTGRNRGFRSAAPAQTWLEWRQRGLRLPLVLAFLMVLIVPSSSLLEQFLRDLMAVTVPEELRPVVDQVPAVWLVLGLLYLSAPPTWAGLLGGDLGLLRVSNQGGGTVREISSFLALRPMTCSELVAAKLRMAAWSTLGAWAVVLVAAACWLLGSGHCRDLLDAPFLEHHRGWQIAVGIVLVLGVLVVGTWLTLVSALWLGLAGRGWVNLVAGLLFTIFWAPIGLVGYGLWHYPEYLPLLWRVLPWLAVVSVLLKFALAAWIARAVHGRRLVAPRTLVIGGVVWIVGVGGLLVLLAGYLPAGLLPLSGLVLAAALLVPLNGLVAMPLALDWNRHR